MDTRAKFICGIIFCFISIGLFGQAPIRKTTDSILVVKDQYGNSRYSISPDKLASFYVAQRNLKLVAKELQLLKGSYDTLTIKNERIESNYKQKEDSLVNIQKLLQEEVNSCKVVVVDVDKDNYNLQKTIERVKSNRKYYYIAGVATPIVITVVVIAVKNSLIP